MPLSDFNGPQRRNGLAQMDPFELAALRQRRAVRPEGGRQDAGSTDFLGELLIPQSPADVALLALGGGPGGMVARKLGAKGLAALLGLAGAASWSDEAEAGPLSAVRKVAGAIKPERIDRAAVRIGDSIYGGRTHADAIRSAEGSTGKGFNELVDIYADQPGALDGFLTSTGRFVSRNEANEIAERAAQWRRGPPPPGEGAISEDLRGLWSFVPPAAVAGVGAMAAPSDAEAGPLSAVRKGIRAFHGSPYDFDKFDMSKMSMGEGSQAYGRGLYFAELEPVAREYRDGVKRRIPVTREDFERARAAGLPLNQGRMYEVNINAAPEELLDWDKPLRDQGEAVSRLIKNPEALGLKPVGPLGQKGFYGYADDKGRIIGGRRTGSPPETPFSQSEIGMSLYKGMGSWPPDEATERLRAAGIPGIKYLDQGSRATGGEGSRNYVVFDDSLIDIIRKYGLAGMAFPGALAAGAASNADATPFAP